MSKLSKRLEMVASFIDENDKSVIDIGCDHGDKHRHHRHRQPQLPPRIRHGNARVATRRRHQARLALPPVLLAHHAHAAQLERA